MGADERRSRAVQRERAAIRSCVRDHLSDGAPLDSISGLGRDCFVRLFRQGVARLDQSTLEGLVVHTAAHYGLERLLCEVSAFIENDMDKHGE